MATLNGDAGQRDSFDALDALVAAQAYRLAYWRVAADEINYRRFFDINDLAALRMEDPAVFEATHRLVLDLLAQRLVDGLRIDHPDGLYDPAAYFARLQERYAQVTGVAAAAADAAAVRAGREDRRAARAVAWRLGRATAPPATVSPTWSPACSSTARRARGSTAPGARSPATRPRTSTCSCTAASGWCWRPPSPGSSRCWRARWRGWRARTGTRATSPRNALRRALGRGGRVLPGLSHLRGRPAERAGSPLVRLGGGARAPLQPRRRTERPRLHPRRAARHDRRPVRRPRCARTTAPSCGACSSSPRRSPPRASRTRRSTAIRGCSRSTRSAATPTASA